MEVIYNMLRLVYILALIFVPYILINIPVVYNRLFLKNDIERQAAPLVQLALNQMKLGKEFSPHEYTEVIFNPITKDEVEMVVEVFIHNYNVQGWNPYNNLVQISGLRTLKDGKYYYTVSDIVNKNSRDLGMIVPIISNRAQDEWSRSDHN